MAIVISPITKEPGFFRLGIIGTRITRALCPKGMTPCLSCSSQAFQQILIITLQQKQLISCIVLEQEQFHEITNFSIGLSIHPEDT